MLLSVCAPAMPVIVKFDAWAATVPHTIGNPLYHWTHLELRRPFGITGKLLSPATSEEIWQRGNELLAQDPSLRAALCSR